MWSGRGLVGDHDQPRFGMLRANGDECGEEHLLVGWPGRAGDERRRPASKPKKGIIRGGGADAPLDAIEARVAEHANRGARHAQRDEPRRIGL